MGYIKALITILAAVLFFIIGLPVGLVVIIVSLVAPGKEEAIIFPFIKFGLRMVGAATGCKVTVIGRENLPAGAALYVSNHRSIFDIIFTCCLIPGRFVPVAKKELKNIPFLHFWTSRIHVLFLDRKDIKAGVQMVNDAAADLKSGASVYICPEGTRNHTEGTFLDFKGGSFKIAIKADAPIVPVTIINSGDVFEDHFPKIKSVPVTIVIDKPIETRGMSIPDRKLLPEKCKEIIMANYEKYKG